jgi:hypothetical protein
LIGMPLGRHSSAEAKLAQLVGSCQDVAKQWKFEAELDVVAPPPAVAIPCLERLAAARQDQIQRLAHVGDLPEATVAAEAQEHEVEECGVPHNSPAHLLPQIVQFYERRSDWLSQKSHLYRVRFERFCTGAAAVAKATPMLQARYRTLTDETRDCTERLQRLHRGLATQKSSMMRPSDVTIYLRWLHHHQSSTQCLNLFFQRLMWLASVHRFDLFKQCHQRLRRMEAKIHTEFYVTGALRKSKSTCHWVEVTVSKAHPIHSVGVQQGGHSTQEQVREE